MDLWVIAAAAGAGYAAKNLQSLSADKRESSGGNSLKYSYNLKTESRNFLQQLRDKTCPLRRLAQQDNDFLDVDINSLSREEGAASVSGESFEERLEFEDGGNRNFSRGKLVKDRRCVHPMRRLNSLDSCVENMEQSTSLCPSVSTVRPVLVTDRRWGNSSTYVDFDDVKRENAASSSSSSKQVESGSNLQQNGYRDVSSARSQAGPETMLLFITGMSIGILSATWSWKKEVDKLNKQLKQMDNLVQDLHEELDMKETLMVKELQLTDEGPSVSISSPAEKIGELDSFVGLTTSEKNAEKLELFSRIEEELQAELEMLEQNMKVSAVERLSSVVEIDPDFEPEIVQGELKATMVNAASDSGTETTDSMNNCSKPANYAVSPRELSLRLHELLESRLEARIKELEIELRNSQNMISTRFSYSETESSSTQQSPTSIYSGHDKLQEEASTCKGNNGILLKVIDKDQEKEDGENRSETSVQDMQQRRTSFMYNEDSTSEDEDSDESDMLLIKQILERRKSGSNFNLRID